MLHYWATGFYAPILSAGVQDKGDLLIYAVSDSHSEKHTVKAKVRSFFLTPTVVFLLYHDQRMFKLYNILI